MSVGKGTLSILLFLLIFSDKACSQYSCSNKPDGLCLRCDCVPDCFDLSDEIDCTNTTDIRDQLLQHFSSTVLNKDADVEAKFFPAPPLPPFSLCHDNIISSSTEPSVTAYTSIVPPSRPPPHTRIEKKRTLSSSTISRALVSTPKEVSTSTFIVEKTKLPQWLCSEYNRFYYFYCRYPNTYSRYCTNLVSALQTCVDVRPAVTSTTTTTPTPLSYPQITFSTFTVDYPGGLYGSHYDYDYFIFR